MVLLVDVMLFYNGLKRREKHWKRKIVFFLHCVSA